jgi:acyl-CoA synthetase (AMP-forming)/AMP-acid ligase II
MRCSNIDGCGFAKQFWPERLEPVEAVANHAGKKIRKCLIREKIVGNG